MKKAFVAYFAAALLFGGAFLPSAPVFAHAEEGTLLSSCTTYYNTENKGRAHNIELAASRIDGIVLEPKEVFSFNGAAGERTKENGYEEAPVIERGEYALGIGGGVCQVSSTLFAAALEGGMRILESRPHSLPVSYLPPSLDAMVSTWSDLKFMNAGTHPVRIGARAEGGELTVSFFGTGEGLLYRAESVLLSEGEEGILSESYLLVFAEGGELIARTRIRRDVYLLPPQEGEKP